MDIDLNLAVCDEVETNACSLSSSSSSSSIHEELWRACAGPVTVQHKKGDLVVYFPQEHLERAGSSIGTLLSDLPSRILCRVVDVQLLVCVLHESFLFFKNVFPFFF